MFPGLTIPRKLSLPNGGMVIRRTQLRRVPFSRMSPRRIDITNVKWARYPLRHVHKLASQNDSKAPPLMKACCYKKAIIGVPYKEGA